MAGIIAEGKSIIKEDLDETTMDACLIAAAQRAEHYEMAAYGTLVAWARAMGHDEAAGLLEQTLDEEKAAGPRAGPPRASASVWFTSDGTGRRGNTGSILGKIRRLDGAHPAHGICLG